jgi:hypothetical protein
MSISSTSAGRRVAGALGASAVAGAMLFGALPAASAAPMPAPVPVFLHHQDRDDHHGKKDRDDHHGKKDRDDRHGKHDRDDRHGKHDRDDHFLRHDRDDFRGWWW